MGTGHREPELEELQAVLSSRSGQRVRREEVDRARNALIARNGDYPTREIAATLIQCLLERRLP